jgi:hypothetical protein
LDFFRVETVFFRIFFSDGVFNFIHDLHFETAADSCNRESF